MVVRGLAVGIKPSLSACSMPLIRWLASAMQRAHWKVFFFDSGRMEAAAFVLLQLRETNKHTIKHNETSKTALSEIESGICAKRPKKKKNGPCCTFNIFLSSAWWQIKYIDATIHPTAIPPILCVQKI